MPIPYSISESIHSMTDTTQRVAQRVALVTGSSSGIGRLTAISLSANGWNVILSGRREAELKETAKMCAEKAQNGVTSLVSSGDVGKEENVKVLFERIREVYGRLDLLFNNAGISGKGVAIEDLDLEEFLSVMSVNVTGAVLCTKYATRMMKEQVPQGGRIINNGSISAYAPRPDRTSYTISKHAISGLTKSTSLDGRKYNIACSQLDIGNAATAMGGRQANGVPQADGTIKPEATFNAQEVADAVVFMSGLGLGTNCFNVTIMATTMPYIGRG